MRRLLNVVPLIGFLVMVLLPLSAMSVGRDATSYRVVIDAVTTGGGPQASANFSMADSAAGEALPAGGSASAQYRNEAGVVVAWQGATGVDAWIEY